MARKRPCRICRRWFLPHPRVKVRQRVCSSAQCQRERHRRACQGWRQRNPEYDRDRRLRERLTAGPVGSVGVDPLRRINWLAARDAVGLEVCVVIEESATVLMEFVRDAVGVQLFVTPRKCDGHARTGPQDEIAERHPAAPP